MSAKDSKGRLPFTGNLKSLSEIRVGERALRNDKCSSHIATVAALANLASAQYYCLSALIRLSPRSEAMDSRREQVFFL